MINCCHYFTDRRPLIIEIKLRLTGTGVRGGGNYNPTRGGKGYMCQIHHDLLSFIEFTIVSLVDAQPHGTDFYWAYNFILNPIWSLGFPSKTPMKTKSMRLFVVIEYIQIVCERTISFLPTR